MPCSGLWSPRTFSISHLLFSLGWRLQATPDSTLLGWSLPPIAWWLLLWLLGLVLGGKLFVFARRAFCLASHSTYANWLLELCPAYLRGSRWRHQGFLWGTGWALFSSSGLMSSPSSSSWLPILQLVPLLPRLLFYLRPSLQSSMCGFLLWPIQLDNTLWLRLNLLLLCRLHYLLGTLPSSSRWRWLLSTCWAWAFQWLHSKMRGNLPPGSLIDRLIAPSRSPPLLSTSLGPWDIPYLHWNWWGGSQMDIVSLDLALAVER